MVVQKFVKGTQIGVGDVIELEDLSSNIIVASYEGDDNIPELLKLIVRTDAVNYMKNANIGIDSKLVVIPRVVQITSKQYHILNRVNLGRSAKLCKGCRICDSPWIPSADPL